MVVIIVERVKPALRGEITRWLIEPKTGVFVGNLSARVREKLWEHVCTKTKDGGAIILWSANTEQGFRCEFWGTPSKILLDWDGLLLIAKPQ